MADLVTAIRHALGLDRPAVSRSDAELVNRRLTQHAIRLRALDAKVDADFPPRGPKSDRHRRGSDQ